MKKLYAPIFPLLLTACAAVGPDYTPPLAALPPQYSTAGGDATLRSHWWETLGDAALNALMQRALADSPDIEIAAARLRQARAVQGVHSAIGEPTLGVGAKVMDDRLSKNGEMFANLPNKNAANEFTNTQIGFDASWEIDLFGRRQRLSEAAEARSQAGVERLRDVELVLAAEVARNYIELRQAQLRLALVGANLRNYDELARLAAFSAKVGEGAALDAQRAAANRDNYAATQANLELAVRQSLGALAVLTGAYIEELAAQLALSSALLSTSSSALSALPAAPAAGLPSDLLKRRPDVRQAERELAAASADIGVATAELYPRFSLLGNAGWNSVHASSLTDHASRFWSLGPQLSLPLFNGERLRHQVAANQAAFDAAFAAYKKSLLAAVADVEVALSRLARSEERHRQLREAEVRQREMLRLTERQLKAGEVAKLAVLDAKRNLAAQQEQTLQAHAQSLTALVALYKALGGGVE